MIHGGGGQPGVIATKRLGTVVVHASRVSQFGHQRSVEVCRRTSAKADTESRCTTVPPQALFPAMMPHGCRGRY